MIQGFIRLILIRNVEDNDMKILCTLEKGETRDIYFPPSVFQKLNGLGKVVWNEFERPLTSHELAELIPGTDICLTHWECPVFNEEVLAHADRLKMIAHAAGSVADFITEKVYDRGIIVCSANKVMAKSVAEGALADILAGLRLIPQQAYELKYGKKWDKKVRESRDLAGAKIGMIGLGTVGRNLIDLLVPFHPMIRVYDPYLNPESLQKWNLDIQPASLDEVLQWGNIITLHASLTRETRGMLNAEKLSLIGNHALLVNTARSGIIDTEALTAELASGRLNAVLDVFDTEPLPDDSPLRSFDNVILLPHVAGITAKEQMTFAMLDEIDRFINGKPLEYEIPRQVFERMTQEHLPDLAKRS